MTDFVHLHVHTQYSLLDGAIRIDDMVKRAVDYNMAAAAVTDHGVMYGILEFYQKAHKAGVKPIIGCECYMADNKLTDKTPGKARYNYHLVLLAKNMKGYQNLCKMATVAQLKGFYYKPRIDKELLEAHCDGLIALSACLKGEVPTRILEKKPEEADQTALYYQKLFGEDNFFLELQDNGIDEQYIVNEAIIDMSDRLSIPLVATCDSHYLDKSDVNAHDALLCIQTGKLVNDTNRLKFGTDQLYFKSGEEMEKAFSHCPEAVTNTGKIAERCHIEFDFKTYHFPKFESEDGLSADDLFRKTVREGFEKRFKKIKETDPDVDEAVYRERLNYEIDTIISMGFPGYFLIVADFIQFGKNNGVPVGPGRGSAAGSMVAFSMGITDLDPIRHGLIFERFLNPSRISMPDIDVDFCINGRDKVFKYVVDKYGGGDYVSLIITFGKLKSRAVIRDVGRVLDIPLSEVDMIAKLVPEVINIKLKDALKEEPKLKEMVDTKPHIKELMDICLKLEGLTRHASVHAAGVVIGDKPLVEYLPLTKGKKEEVVTQFDMKNVEKIGLVKFDFLGLRNLTVIENALQLIESQGSPRVDINNLDFCDKKTFELLQSGDTTGVFQLESSGMKELMIRLKPACFDDITALVALYRPGPLESGMADEFVERKHGRKKVVYAFPQLEPILKETYGVVIYQEQVMRIAGVLANYTMADADGLRKAMGKKIAEMMAEHRVKFLAGAKENNLDETKAKEIFDQMEKFGRYGFNKSHSAAYALIAFQTAYLKAHYPVEFMASLLTSEMHSIDGVVKFISECRSHGIEVLPPDINESYKTFTVNNGAIRFGLVAVKNVGEGAIESIIETREEGKFCSFLDFCERIDYRKINKRVVESLIKCGAFDSLGNTRAQLMQFHETALEFGQKIQKERKDPQMGLFETCSQKTVSLNAPTPPDVQEWDSRHLLANEKESLGFYITGHPLHDHADVLKHFTNANAVTVKEMSDNAKIRIGGIVLSVKKIRTKRGDPMGYLLLEDLDGTMEVTVFPSVYEKSEYLLTEDQAVFVEGKLQVNENSMSILADTIIPMEAAEEKWTAEIHFNLDVTKTDKEKLIRLKELIRENPGNAKAFLNITDPGKTRTLIALPQDLNIKSSKELKQRTKEILGYQAVFIRPSAIMANGFKKGYNGGRKGKRS